MYAPSVNARCEPALRRLGRAALRRFAASLPTLAAIAAVALLRHGRQLAARPHGRRRLALRAQFDAARAARARARSADRRDWTRMALPAGRRAPANYDAARQILIDNKVHAGRAGFHVVTPLDACATAASCSSTAAGSRAGATRAELPEVAAAGRDGHACTGASTIPPARATSSCGRDAPAGAVWQNLDPRASPQATGIAVLPIVVEQTATPAFPTTGWCATGPRPISASRSTGSTWCSGTRSRPSRSCCGCGSRLRARRDAMPATRASREARSAAGRADAAARSRWSPSRR